jgi:hypothetical protein
MTTIELLGLLTLLARKEDGSARGAGPAERTAPCPLRDVERVRSLWCPAYDRCLDAAFRRGWQSWTCERCTLFPCARPSRVMEGAGAAAARPLA